MVTVKSATTLSTERIDRALAALDAGDAEGREIGRAAVAAMTALAGWGVRHDANVRALLDVGDALARAAVAELPPPVPTPARVDEEGGFGIPRTTGAELRHLADSLDLPGGWRVKADLRQGRLDVTRSVITPDGRQIGVPDDRLVGMLVAYAAHLALHAVGQLPTHLQPFSLAGVWAQLIGTEE
jgi:hypothetical protein